MLKTSDSTQNKILGLIAFPLFCVLFYFLKWEHLHLPHFWDEAWVYAPAVKVLAKNSLSILPSALSPDYSRGHPLLFHFVSACWIKLFGSSALSLHHFALFLSYLLAGWLFFLTQRFTKDALIASLAVLLLFSQSMFIAQAAMVLPEVFMALFVLLCLWKFVAKQHVQLAVFLTLGLFIKESFLMIYFLFVGIELLLYLKELKQGISKINWKKILLYSIPACLFLLFLFIQKQTYGWYFYPTHIGMINLSLDSFIWIVFVITSFLFVKQGRYLITLLLVVLGFLYSKKQLGKLALICWLSLLLYFGVNLFWGSTYLVLGCGIITLVAWLFVMLTSWNTAATFSNFCILSIGYIILYSSFCGFNFFSNRYLISFLPILILIIVVLLHKTNFIPAFIKYILLVCISAFCLFKGYQPENIGDTESSFSSAIKVQQEVVRFCEENNFYQTPIFAPFLDENNLKNPLCGYRNTEIPFKKVTNDAEQEVGAIYIFNNIEIDANRDSILAKGQFELLKTYSHKMAEAKIYKKIKNL